jgi:hypothetical protein
MDFFFKLSIFLASISMVSVSYANSLGNITLKCKMTKYDIGNNLTDYTNYGLDEVKSFIPSKYILYFTPKGSHYGKYEIEVTKNTQDKIYFEYYTKDKSHMHDYLSLRPWKHIYFKKNKILNVYFEMYDESLNIWGNCIKETSKTKKAKETNKISNKIKNIEDKCSEIGFKKGTEKFGECVLKLIDFK